MKFLVAVLSVCLVHICSASDNVTEGERNEAWKQYLHDDLLNGASEQFADDVSFVLDKMKNNRFIRRALGQGFFEALSRRIRGTNHAKLDVESVRAKHAELYKIVNFREPMVALIDNLKVIQSILSESLPAERYNGLMNLCFVTYYPNVTDDEIANVLGYLYGTETKPTIISIPDLTPDDCPTRSHRYLEAIDKLKSMIDIKSKVIEDSTIIRDKFPCNSPALEFSERFAYSMEQLQGDRSKIDACAMKKNMSNEQGPHLTRNAWDLLTDLEQLESILSTRLTDETFRGMMNFISASKAGATMHQIQKSLGYLYDDVSPKNCELKLNSN